MTILLIPPTQNELDEVGDGADAIDDVCLFDLSRRFPIDGRDGIRVAVQMLHAGEINRREFFELCEEAAEAVG